MVSLCFALKRIESLKAFAEGVVDFMLATDLASRGLDIERVKTVSRADTLEPGTLEDPAFCLFE